ncbi:hypothetical protein Tco_0890322 [Tanacetum coccineum]|uniref:Uncharacterized protein n=1 Tax=Tanacetum coccineum TaxID=301880 RepID=A0ABQ5BZQ6_9ASTR
MNPSYELVIDDLESDIESYETPLVSPFLDSDEESDDGKVIDESNEYRNTWNFYHNKTINSFDENDLAFLCMIGPAYQVDESMKVWFTRGHVSIDGVIFDEKKLWSS